MILSNKKKPVLSPHKLRLRYAKYEIRPFRDFVEAEVNAILDILFYNSYHKGFRRMLANYAIIVMVSGIEHYTRHFVRKLIDENNIDISQFFEGDIELFLNQKRQELGRTITKGHLFSMSYDFTNQKELNNVMSRLLGLDFFETIKLLDDDKDSFKFHARSRSMHANMHNFVKLFEMRNNIIHGLKRYSLKPTQIRSLAENTYFYTENLSVFYIYYGYTNGRLHLRTSPNSQRGRWFAKIDQQKALYRSSHSKM